MKNLMTFPNLTSLALTLGQNLVPVALLFKGYASETTFILYFLETLLSILLTALLIRLRAPTQDPAYAALSSSRMEIRTNGHLQTRYEVGSRKTMLDGFLMFTLGFSVIPGIFVAMFLFLILKADLSIGAIRLGLIGILAFQILNWLVDFFIRGELTPEGASLVMQNSMQRTAIIYVACFLGVILAVFVRTWFIVPFVALKLLADFAPFFKNK